jgi:hypothetical protein
MRFFKQLIIVILLLSLIFIGVGFTLPDTYSIKREIEIEAAPDVVFDEINNLLNWEHWSPWSDDINNKQLAFSQVAIGEGAWQKWQSKSFGEGKLDIKRVSQGKMLLYELIYKDYNMLTTGEFNLVEVDDNKTRVIWKDCYNAGNNILYRYFGLFANKFFGSNFETGLVKLKNRIENKQLAS